MSLKRIVLRDFVIVSALDLDLTTGFTVLTGETGAGKSILLGALQLVTGGRSDVGVIREGMLRADVSAEFDATAALLEWLEIAGFEQGESLLLRRTVDLQGKSRAWINGSPATLTQLREIGEHLLDIHGQHAWQSLTRPAAVRDLLDAYAGISAGALAARWQAWHQAQRDLQHALDGQQSQQLERERLAWQIGEVEKLAPLADEWDALNVEHARLSNAQALLDAAQGAVQRLDGDERGALAALHGARQLLQLQVASEPHFAAMTEVLSSSLAQLEDTVHSLRAYLHRTEPDPQRLGELDQRMGLWLSLARRYKRGPAELPDLLAQWKQELQTLDAAVDLTALEAAQRSALESYLQAAKQVSAARHAAAPKLGAAVTLAMQGLGMQGGQFKVELEACAQPTQSGLEEVGFLVAGHAGSTPHLVNKVASGGELSRIALAIAVTTSRLGTAQTLIFDEVDAGIGGAVAQTVGRLMKLLGQDRQVLAVTHLPQVAACADQHLVVAKAMQGSSVVSSVVAVQGEQRIAEVARMLGGERLSETTLAHAREMLQGQE